jgi:hypothetical protein
MDALGPIEVLFLLAPVAVVPLGLGLLVRTNGRGGPWRLAGRLQPWAAAAAVLSFLIGHRGLIAGVLAAPWLVVTLLVAVGGAERAGHAGARLRTSGGLPVAAGLAGCAMLPVGGAWLVVSRLGLTPLGFEEPLPLLTAVHFHYAAFAAPVLVAQAGAVLGAGRAWRASAAGAIAGPPLLAAGITLSPTLEVVAATLVVLALSSLAVLTLARIVPRLHGAARLLLAISSVSALAAMACALAYAVGQFTGTGIFSLAGMARIHGPLNALGFALAGLLGWSAAPRNLAPPSL